MATSFYHIPLVLRLHLTPWFMQILLVFFLVLVVSELPIFSMGVKMVNNWHITLITLHSGLLMKLL